MAVELIYDYFEDHVRAAAAVNERRPLALGILCFIIGGLSLFVAQALAQRLHVFSFSWASCLLAISWKVLAGFLLAACLHLILEMGGIRGSAAGLFILFGMADLAWALAVPLILLARAFWVQSSWAITGIFFSIGILSLSLKARGLQDNYRIGLGRAWFTLGLPYLAALAIGMLVFSLAMLRLVVELLKAFG